MRVYICIHIDRYTYIHMGTRVYRPLDFCTCRRLGCDDLHVVKYLDNKFGEGVSKHGVRLETLG